MGQVKGWANPLMLIAASGDDVSVNADDILKFLTTANVELGSSAFVGRYNEIKSVTENMWFAPAEQNILEKTIWPLRHAIGSYALGNYLGCIALCGFVGEMIALLLWDISDPGIEMSDKDQIQLFGRTFEKLGQERRVDVLVAKNLIDGEVRAHFTSLRTIRRKYLHFLSHSHGEIEGDARAAYKAAFRVVDFVLGAKVNKGKIVLRRDLEQYLERHGVLTEVDSEESA